MCVVVDYDLQNGLNLEVGASARVWRPPSGFSTLLALVYMLAGTALVVLVVATMGDGKNHYLMCDLECSCKYSSTRKRNKTPKATPRALVTPTP